MNETYKDLLHTRKSLLSRYKHSVIKKGNRKINQTRFCAVCGKPLSRYIVDDIGIKPYYIAINNHFLVVINRNTKIALCKNIKSCMKRLNIKKEENTK